MTQIEKDFLLLKFKGSGGLSFIDVGANKGDYSKFLLENFKCVNGYMFEPIESCYNYLINNFKEPFLSINNISIGSYKGVIEFNEAVNKETHSSIVNRPIFKGYNISKRLINIDKLDNIIDTKIDLLKIDTEGYEFEVIKGCEQLLNDRMIKYIQFEYGGTYLDNGIKLNDVITFLKSLGYKTYNFHDGKFNILENYKDDYRYNNFYAFFE